jgi:hypothetical protein
MSSAALWCPAAAGQDSVPAYKRGRDYLENVDG